MIFSTSGIKKLIREKKVNIEPETTIKKAFIKIHFSEGITLKPKEFRVSKSRERMGLPFNIAALYDGYTHLARKGVITHLGSMFVYPRTSGNITFEIFNFSDKEIHIRKGERAGHLIFFETSKK